MALPNSYLISTNKLNDVLSAIRRAQAPDRFTLKFLEHLGFTSSNDRLYLSVFKDLGFLDAEGRPTDRYYRFLDESQSAGVMAEALRDAYRDLFQVNRNAHEMSQTEIENKLRTLSQGQHSDTTLKRMATTFKAFAKHADFAMQAEPSDEYSTTGQEWKHNKDEESKIDGAESPDNLQLADLVYNIQIHLPESRDPAVYDALFRSLREHLFR